MYRFVYFFPLCSFLCRTQVLSWRKARERLPRQLKNTLAMLFVWAFLIRSQRVNIHAFFKKCTEIGFFGTASSPRVLFLFLLFRWWGAFCTSPPSVWINWGSPSMKIPSWPTDGMFQSILIIQFVCTLLCSWNDHCKCKCIYIAKSSYAFLNDLSKRYQQVFGQVIAHEGQGVQIKEKRYVVTWRLTGA